MAKATVVVDMGAQGHGETYSVEHRMDSLTEAQTLSAALGTDWALEGFRQAGGVWKRGQEWRQKVIVCGGVEYAEEAGVDE